MAKKRSTKPGAKQRTSSKSSEKASAPEPSGIQIQPSAQSPEPPALPPPESSSSDTTSTSTGNSSATANKAQVATRLLAAKWLVGDLSKIVVDELKAQQLPWSTLPEESQAKAIARIVESVKTSVRKAVMLIATVNRPSAHAEIESVLFKDGIKVQLTMSKQMADRHAIADAQGRSILLVLPDYEATEGGDAPKAEKNQADLLET